MIRSRKNNVPLGTVLLGTVTMARGKVRSSARAKENRPQWHRDGGCGPFLFRFYSQTPRTTVRQLLQESTLETTELSVLDLIFLRPQKPRNGICVNIFAIHASCCLVAVRWINLSFSKTPSILSSPKAFF